MENKISAQVGRREFIKQAGITAAAAFSQQFSSRAEQVKYNTEFKQTNERFRNGEYVYTVEANGVKIGEFWPVRGINLVTRQTDPEVFNASLRDLNKKLKGVATAPDGFTVGSVGNYQMQGKALSNGRPCGDGSVPNYEIVLVKSGFDINFTHKAEIPDFNAFYGQAQKDRSTLFFLPSIYRNGRTLDAKNLIDKILVRREIPNGLQVGVILFDKAIPGNEAREIILGLNRQSQSKTTHMYVLDGGPKWGQIIKEIYKDNTQNPEVEVKGTREQNAVTNYLVFY